MKEVVVVMAKVLLVVVRLKYDIPTLHHDIPTLQSCPRRPKPPRAPLGPTDHSIAALKATMGEQSLRHEGV
mgnify:CR=1 FL=1